MRKMGLLHEKTEKMDECTVPFGIHCWTRKSQLRFGSWKNDLPAKKPKLQDLWHHMSDSVCCNFVFFWA